MILTAHKLATIQNIIRMMRPHQWVKNVFIYAGLVFSQNIYDPQLFLKVTFGFFAFSFAASSIYILNDLKDVESDRQHPEKKNRPLAAGTIGKVEALTVAFFLFIGSVTAAYVLDQQFCFIVIT